MKRLRNPLTACVVCGLPRGACRLVRLTWREDPMLLPDDNGCQLRLVVAATPKANDVLACEACIRGIKRLPFSEVATKGFDMRDAY